MKTEKKETGTYYTPPLLADFMVYHLFEYYNFSTSVDVLEPSSGGGVFFKSLFANDTFNDSRYRLDSILSIDAIERDKHAYLDTKISTDKFIDSPHSIQYFNQDYLQYHLDNKKKYDLVIGNPPYIKSNYLTDKQIKQCEEIHQGSGLGMKSIKNIWTSFLVGGVQSLNDNGVLCFVLPAELLQVIYAKELRNFLKASFARIEIFAFNDLIFEEIEQDVIILICSKQPDRYGTKGVSFYQVEHLNDLKEPLYAKKNSNVHRESLDKWTNYILSDADLKFLDRLRKNMMPIKHYCRAEVGIVTAANDYFIKEGSVIDEYNLSKIARPILKKGSYAKSVANYTLDDYNLLQSTNAPSWFLEFEDKDIKELSEEYTNYLSIGVDRGLHQRYKTLLRKRWYIVPSLWIAEGLFTKRSNIFPRTFINTAGVMATDSFYRIKMNEGYSIKDLTFSFYNSLTFIFAELEGRFYGGSVLELTPNEYKNLIVPFCENISSKQFEKLDSLLRSNADVKEVLRHMDRVVLEQYYGVKPGEIKRLEGIYEKLLIRRLKGKRKAI